MSEVAEKVPWIAAGFVAAEEIARLRCSNAELLAACEAARCAMAAHGPCTNNGCPECGRTWKLIHTAIANARPQTEGHAE